MVTIKMWPVQITLFIFAALSTFLCLGEKTAIGKIVNGALAVCLFAMLLVSIVLI